MGRQDYDVYLNSSETESIFTLQNGDYMIVAGLQGTNTFPATIKLQEHHYDEQKRHTEWSDILESDLTTSSRNAIFASSSAEGLEFRILASASGATVSIFKTAVSTGF